MRASSSADSNAVDTLPTSHGRACDACGSPLDEHDKFCPACGTTHSPPPLPAAPPAASPQKHFRCDNCGAEIACDPRQRSYVCPFCDSTYVTEFTPEVTGKQAPEFVIGFTITPEQAQEAFLQWIGGGGLFRPGNLRRAIVADKLKGVYLPFWSFSMLANSQWSASIGEYWYRTETYTTIENGKTVTRTRQVRETEWWGLSGRFHEYRSGYLVSGSRGLPQGQADRIMPFHLAALKRYEPYFLAGWLNEEYSVEGPTALERCKAEFHRRQQADISSFLPGDTHSNLDVATHFSDINSDLILLPVYLLSYRYQDQVYRFLLNGQSGRMAGDRPYSKPRIAAAVLIGLAVIGAIVLAVLWLKR
ncbi:MAG: zinc ribbon domain-containing protein [Pirellulales bacterium]